MSLIKRFFSVMERTIAVLFTDASPKLWQELYKFVELNDSLPTYMMREVPYMKKWLEHLYIPYPFASTHYSNLSEHFINKYIINLLSFRES